MIFLRNLCSKNIKKFLVRFYFILVFGKKPWNIKQYQGVKEFHLLARMGCKMSVHPTYAPPTFPQLCPPCPHLCPFPMSSSVSFPCPLPMSPSMSLLCPPVSPHVPLLCSPHAPLMCPPMTPPLQPPMSLLAPSLYPSHVPLMPLPMAPPYVPSYDPPMRHSDWLK